MRHPRIRNPLKWVSLNYMETRNMTVMNGDCATYCRAYAWTLFKSGCYIAVGSTVYTDERRFVK